MVGDFVGKFVGCALVGTLEGCCVGDDDGCKDGDSVGDIDGCMVGDVVFAF